MAEQTDVKPTKHRHTHKHELVCAYKHHKNTHTHTELARYVYRDASNRPSFADCPVGGGCKRRKYAKNKQFTAITTTVMTTAKCAHKISQSARKNNAYTYNNNNNKI